MTNLKHPYSRPPDSADSSYDASASSWEFATVLVLLVLANWFVYTTTRNIDFDDRYLEYQTYQGERNAELRYLVRLPIKPLP
jgi:hypothetical protein